ncbi:hypothetical protein ACN38_g5723, partial [Penicillium nordicum]
MTRKPATIPRDVIGSTESSAKPREVGLILPLNYYGPWLDQKRLITFCQELSRNALYNSLPYKDSPTPKLAAKRSTKFSTDSIQIYFRFDLDSLQIQLRSNSDPIQIQFSDMNTTVCWEKAGEEFLIDKTNHAGVYIPCRN